MVETYVAPVSFVTGQTGIAADLVAKALIDAGHDVRIGPDVPERAEAVVLVEPRPVDWQMVDPLEAAIVVFTLSAPDAASLARSLRKGARAVVDGEGDLDAVVRAVEAVGEGRVVLTTPQVELLVNAVEGDTVTTEDDVPRLSPRETQILASIARGESVKQTARGLGISEKTVEHLQSRLHLKLGARTRAQAVTRAHALGLLPDEHTN
jgi:two-component system, NarL family, nitrate/nitrite response regulator NarL